MVLDETILESVAKDGTMDYDKWPGLLDPLLERLDHIVRHNFPLPRVPTQHSYETVSTVPLASQINSQTNSNKENAPPSQLQSPSRPPPVPLFSSPSGDRVPDSQPPPGPADDALPAALFAILSSIKTTLKSSFSKRPPHTIQRIAELILRPTAHYKTLPAYLRALDRVVSVSSTADTFPLPHGAPLPGTTVDGTGIDGVNGVGTTNFMFTDTSLGSDESLGGALLTPIPWLNNPMNTEEDEDPLRQPDGNTAEAVQNSSQSSDAIDEDQHMEGNQEDSTVPGQPAQNPQHQQPSNPVRDGPSTTAEDSEEIPHARGPPVLGVEDLGLQDGKGVEMTLDTQPGNSAPLASAPSDTSNEKPGQNMITDADGDIEIGDAQEKVPVQEQRAEDSEKGKNESDDLASDGP